MTKTVLVHLNVEVPDNVGFNADEIADAILSAIEVGSDDDMFRSVLGLSLNVGDLASGNGAPITCTLAEEV